VVGTLLVVGTLSALSAPWGPIERTT